MIKGVAVERKLMKSHPALWMPMIDTADIVAERYGISRERQDDYSLESQKRTAAAQAAGLFDDEIVPMETVMGVKDKETGEVSERLSKINDNENKNCALSLRQRCSPSNGRRSPRSRTAS
jgi:acetyl-CoA C-acetyltransferase